MIDPSTVEIWNELSGGKRIGYVGLSSPLFYDKKNAATRTANDESTSPNPILDGGVGAMLLYDEIWFLCRSLCPENMRNLKFVRFLDEEQMTPQLDLDEGEKEMFWSNLDPAARKAFRAHNADYQDTRRLLGLKSGEIYTATYNLTINGFLTRGTSQNYAKLYMDVHAVNEMPDSVELITNRITSLALNTDSRASNLAASAESILFRNIQEHLDLEGPYHPYIEELRESTFLSGFRSWILENLESASESELLEFVSEVDVKIAEDMKKQYLKHLDPSQIYRDTTSTVISAFAEDLIPFASTASSIASLAKSYDSYREARKLHWQGFLLEAEKLAQK